MKDNGFCSKMSISQFSDSSVFTLISTESISTEILCKWIVEIKTKFSTMRTIYGMEPVHTDAEEGIKACSCSLEEPSITMSLLVIYESLHLYFFFNFKSKVNY